MTNEELMQMMTDMGLHEGGMENWVVDNAWLRVANAVEEREREACALIVEENANKCGVDTVAWMLLASNAEAIRARGQA